MLTDWKQAWLGSRDNPHLFVTGVLNVLPYGAPNPNNEVQLELWQDQFLRPENFFTDPSGAPTSAPRHSIRSGHGIGKTTLIAWLALWFLCTRYDSKCVISGNSQAQLASNNWSELRKWARKLPEPLQEQIEIHEEKAFLKAAPEMAFVTRRTASKDNPESLAGVHAEHVLYLIDEASGIPDIVFEVAQGSLSSPGAIAVLLGNPTRTSGYFHQTHHVLRDRWKCLRVSSEDVPRARGHIEDIIRSYGKGSNRYRVRVLGEFPSADDETVIALDLIEAARNREVEPLLYRPIWGVDVARFGDDTSALAKRQGNILLEPVREWSQKSTMQLTGLIVEEYYATHEDERPAEILVDSIGIGAGVVDRLAELELPVRGINVAESAAVTEKFHRLRDELWWRGRQWFEARDCCIPDDDKLVSELAAPTYDFSSSGKIIVESKSDMKKRGLKSPNLADAFLLTFATSDQRKRRERPHRPVRRSAWAA